MRWLAGTRQWRVRALGGLLLGGLAYALATWFDFDPQPVPFAVVVVVVGATAFLVVDTVDVPPSHWQHGLPSVRDRADEVTSDLRILSSHQQADHPTEALGHRLVDLAASRDPALAAALRQELAGTHRLSPTDIDRILTRIEDVRDRR